MADALISNPLTEAGRLSELRDLSIVGTPAEEAFDDLTMLAAHICDAPIALISLVDEDRQWFKSRVGLELLETTRLVAFCAQTIAQPEIMVVPDAAEDLRFAANPLVTSAPNIRFYAGAPLITSNGHAIGTLCVIDTIPRELKPDQALALKVLSRQVVAQLELRRSDARRRAAEEALQQSHAKLERAVEERTRELEKARAEADLAKRRISQIIDRISDGLTALDSKSHYIYVNGKGSELLRKKPEELYGRYIWDVFPEAMGLPIHEAYERAIKEQVPVDLQVYYEPWDRWFHDRIYPSENGVSIFFQDITEQKLAEQRLEREKSLSDAIIDSLPGVFYLFDEHGRFLRWNKHNEEVTGLSSEEFSNTRALELVAPADRESVAKAIAKVFAEGESSTEARIRSTDGTEIWHLCSGRRINFAGRNCLVGLAVDISERKRTEEMLRNAQTNLELAVRASGVGLWDWDIAHDHAVVSTEWQTQFGFDQSEFSHPFALWESRLHPDDRDVAVNRLKTYMENPSGEYQSEVRLRDNEGVYRWIFTRAQLLHDEHGKPVRMLGCHIDVTQHRTTQDRLLEQREQLRALAQHLNLAREQEAGRIARELHDELGAALTGLKIDINRLGHRLEKESVEAQRAHIQNILASIDSTIRSVRKICLDLRPAILDQLGLSAAVEWLVSEFQNRTGIQCDLRQPETISLPPECATTIFRILQELLTNIARHAKAKEVCIELRQEPDKILLRVEDNGKGLPADALTRDDRFGLLGVRERALAIGGKVDFDSSRNRGTRVVVCIPID